jgi:transposase
MPSIAHVGMDVHKKTIRLAVYLNDSEAPIDQVTLPTDEHLLLKYLAQWHAKYELQCYYEAGPGGYVIYRWLKKLQIPCLVAAPSKMLKAPGERVKNDTRDARKLAEQGRNHQLTAVRVPTEAEEAVRGVVRCREVRQRDLQASRHRVIKFLALRDRIYSTGKNWTQAHHAWLQRQQFPALDDWTYREYLTELLYREQRLAEADLQLASLAQQPQVQPLMKALCCFRGIETTTAMILIAETLDFRRFGTARGYMSYMGLTCSEHSSGSRQHRGPITKAGSRRGRRVLIEAAWHYRHAPLVSKTLAKRQAGQPAEVIAHAWKAQKRLHQVYWKLEIRNSCKAAAAVARELAGFVWAAAQMILTDAA